MKKVTLFIKAKTAFSPDTLCVRLMVGASLRDRSQFSWLKETSASNGWFLSPWNSGCQEFYERLRCSVDVPLVTCILDISDVCRMIKNNHYDIFAESFVNAVRGCTGRLVEHDVYDMARHRANLAVRRSTSTLPTVHV